MALLESLGAAEKAVDVIQEIGRSKWKGGIVGFEKVLIRVST